MQLLVLALDLGSLLAAHLPVLTTDPVPAEEDVKAGWTAFLVFILLILALAGLGVGLSKQLKRTERNRKAGMFGPVDDEEPGEGPPAQP